MSLLGNRLVDLPQGVGLLCRLEELDVSFNLLERLPEELGQLQDLQTLELSNNRLRALPETLGDENTHAFETKTKYLFYRLFL